MIEKLPCATCTALCCGPVPITAARAPAIRRHLTTLSAKERWRLRKQKRDDLDCGFLDKEHNRCSIYHVRPWVCVAFGRVPGLQCPKVDRLVQIIPAIVADEQFERETSSPVVASSIEWNWKKMDFE